MGLRRLQPKEADRHVARVCATKRKGLLKWQATCTRGILGGILRCSGVRCTWSALEIAISRRERSARRQEFRPWKHNTKSLGPMGEGVSSFKPTITQLEYNTVPRAVHSLTDQRCTSWPVFRIGARHASFTYLPCSYLSSSRCFLVRRGYSK